MLASMLVFLTAFMIGSMLDFVLALLLSLMLAFSVVVIDATMVINGCFNGFSWVHLHYQPMFQPENSALEVNGLLASYLPEIETEVLEAYPNARNEIATAEGRRSIDFSGSETPADSAEETPAAPAARPLR